ncbi:MAG: DUF1638 domain-containing protein [Alphaproteobacteria bacterium]|nr:DUF1638 domain-containing protein [Alphaproteobacteria bacterium]
MEPQLNAAPRTLLIACGALAREMLALIEANGWTHLTLECLPAKLHNRPERIPEAVRGKIREKRAAYDTIFVAYADCGTGGLLDKVLAEEGVARIAGPHCYSFYAGADTFDALHDEEPGSFYLTDYLARHFDTLIIKGMGLDRYPQLMADYFGNYRRLVYLAQTEDEALQEKAKQAAETLGLAYEYRFTGYGELTAFMAGAAGE